MISGLASPIVTYYILADSAWSVDGHWPTNESIKSFLPSLQSGNLTLFLLIYSPTLFVFCNIFARLAKYCFSAIFCATSVQYQCNITCNNPATNQTQKVDNSTGRFCKAWIRNEVVVIKQLVHEKIIWLYFSRLLFLQVLSYWH